MELKDKNGKTFDVKTIQEPDKISFLVFDADDEIGHLVLSKKEDEHGHLPIKDAAINLSNRGTGLWKSLMTKAKDFVETLGYAGLVSYGQFRRPASDKSWLGIKDRIDNINPKTHKHDYVYEMKHLKMFENFDE